MQTWRSDMLLTRRSVGSAALIAATFAAGAPGLPAQAPPAPAALLGAAKSWGYQLQKINPAVIASAPYDVFVIDYSSDGDDEHAFTPEDIARLKRKPDGGRRIVLCYLSIGEAESYRYYWRPEWDIAALAPAWLAAANKRYRSNILVRYWWDEWQAIVFRGENSYLDRILAAGFDGVYLDRVDVEQEFEAENPSAREQMVAFVKAIAERARARNPDFLVVPQNAEELLDDASYRAAIDGIAKEDLLFGDGRSKRANAPERIAAGVRQLRQMTAERKPVFVVEYLDKPEDITAARTRIEGYGFIPHFAKRGLDVMRIGDLPPAPRPRVPAKTEKGGRK
jgi:cysteinyl-tRNA synthetase